nr:ribonucleoside triphosphate reductase [Nanoarchaeota archaeon]
MAESYTIDRVKKRDGKIVLFNEDKIVQAIFKAAKAAGGEDYETAKALARKVTKALETFFKGGSIQSIELIQDFVEKILIEQGHAETAKAYILYRKQHEELRKARTFALDVQKTTEGYLNQSDWRVSENSNINYSLSGLLFYSAGTVLANYTLNKVYPKEVGQAHRNGDFHIHDLSMGIAGYCAGWSLRQLIEEGFNGVPGKTESLPANHLSSLLWQMINFIGTLQNEWAGAQAFSSFDTYLAPFIKTDNLNYKQVKQALQGFVFNMNVSSRWGGQTPFTNITLDWVCPEDMRNKKAIVGGKEQNFTYSECQKEMDMINKAFIEVMTEGDAKGRIFTFPIPTYNITREFNWDSENAKMLFEMTAKYGIPYFQNFINSDLKPGDVRSMCCRLQMDMRELRARGGGLFGSAEMTGSLGVITLNLPRIGYLSQTKEEFFKRVEKLMDIAKDALEIKRKQVTHNIEHGLMPFSKRYLSTLANHFCTIGLNGMNEALLNFLGPEYNIATKEGKEFAEEVLDFMREKLKKFQAETGHMYNLEATPAEGTAYRLAKIDKKAYPKIITAGVKDPYYTNSTQLPVGYTDDIFEALELQDSLQVKYTGGTVLHGFLGERVGDAETCKKLVKRIAENFRLPYFTITPTFSVCPEHGYIKGEHHTCPLDKKIIIKEDDMKKALSA